jgi:uncharacterized cupin superfamily protein
MTTTHRIEELLVRHDDAELLDSDPNGTIRLLADTDATGGLLSSHRSTFKHGSDGAPPHYHADSAELFFVIDGELDVLVGETVKSLHTGDFLLVPPGLAHAFAASAEADADVLFGFVPGCTPRADYYRLLDRVHRGEASWQDIGDTQDLYDNHYVDSPAWAARGTK